MDYCCGGKQILVCVVLCKVLDVVVIEVELVKLVEQFFFCDWCVVFFVEIIDYIIVCYYDWYCEQLLELILQVIKVECVYVDKLNVLKGLIKYLIMLYQEFFSYMMKEEQILFLMIKQGMGVQVGGLISVMESEYDEVGELLEVIKYIIYNVMLLLEVCIIWKVMYNGINEMIDDLMEYISLENNVLFLCVFGGK